jgi:hypothetical protein
MLIRIFGADFWCRGTHYVPHALLYNQYKTTFPLTAILTSLHCVISQAEIRLIRLIRL